LLYTKCGNYKSVKIKYSKAKLYWLIVCSHKVRLDAITTQLSKILTVFVAN